MQNFLTNKKFLITGGAGYLGSTLTEVLLDKGYHVDVLDNLIYEQTSLLHLCSDKTFRFINRDVTDFKFLKRIVHLYDVIIPLAAIVGAPACDKNKELATKVNFEQIKCIVDNLTDEQKLIMPNTNSQYGSSEEVITEDSSFNPDKNLLDRIEHRIEKKEQLPVEHVIAYRLAKEEILYVWLECVENIIKNYFIQTGSVFDDKKLFQEKFPPEILRNIIKFISNFRNC